MNKYNRGDKVLYTSIFEAFHFACSSGLCLDESNPRRSFTVAIQYKNRGLKGQQLQDGEAPNQEKGRKIISTVQRSSCVVVIRAFYPSLDIPHASTASRSHEIAQGIFKRIKSQTIKNRPLCVMRKDVGSSLLLPISRVGGLVCVSGTKFLVARFG